MIASWYDIGGTELSLPTDIRMSDGSRLFVTLPKSVMWHGVRDHVGKLPGAELTGFLCDGVTEAWIDFRFREHLFALNDQLDEYWFFVNDPMCPDEILLEVVGHFSTLLSPSIRDE